MKPRPSSELADLSPEERGFVLGAGLLGDPGLAEHLAIGSRARCVAALTELWALPRDDRARALGRLVAEVPSRLPGEVAGTDPSAITAALATEPSELLVALVAGLPAEIREQALSVIRGRGEDPGAIQPARVDPDLLPELQQLLLAHLFTRGTRRGNG